MDDAVPLLIAVQVDRIARHHLIQTGIRFVYKGDVNGGVAFQILEVYIRIVLHQKLQTFSKLLLHSNVKSSLSQIILAIEIGASSHQQFKHSHFAPVKNKLVYN